LPPSARDQPRKGSRRGQWSPDYTRDANEKILSFLKSQGKKGASIAEIVAATEIDVDYLRMRFLRLKQDKIVSVKGNTTKARYFLVH
jgi:hypothetical protein